MIAHLVASLASRLCPRHDRSVNSTLARYNWKAVSLPILAFGAKKDRGDPAKYCKKLVGQTQGEHAFYLLSKKEGFSKDYGHVDMVVSKEAAEEVWPKAIDWLKNH